MDEPRIVRAFDIDDAIDNLEDMPGVVEWLEVAMMRYPNWTMTDEEERDRYVQLLHRFVELLDDPESQSIQELILYDAHFDAHEGPPRNHVERLLRDVVPSYRTLQKLALASCVVDAPLLHTLALALPPSQTEAHNDLWQFSLYDVSMGVEGLRVVANDVIRRNLLLRSLYLDLTRFHSAACELVCRSLRHNTNLRRLFVGTNDVTGGTLKHIAGPTSPLRYLSVGGNWTMDGIAELASQLKTNTRMLALSLSGPIVGFHPDDVAAVAAAERAAAPLVEMLRTYNYTLQKLKFVERRAHGARKGKGRNRGIGPGVECVRWDFFVPYIRRNRRIRKALKVWEPAAYQVVPISLWPSAFELVRDVPTLLYRLLRRGNVKTLDQVVVVGNDDHPTNSTKKRRARGCAGGGGGRRPRR